MTRLLLVKIALALRCPEDPIVVMNASIWFSVFLSKVEQIEHQRHLVVREANGTGITAKSILVTVDYPTGAFDRTQLKRIEYSYCIHIADGYTKQRGTQHDQIL